MQLKQSWVSVSDQKLILNFKTGSSPVLVVTEEHLCSRGHGFEGSNPSRTHFHIYLLLKLYCLVRNGTIQGDLINGVELTTNIWPAVVFTNYSYCYVVHWEFLPSIVASNVSLNVWSKTGARPN